MGLWDDLNQAMKKARTDAQKKAAETAARSAWNVVKKKVADLGDDFLDAAEKELEEQSGSSERLSPLPSAKAADHRAKVLEERLRDSELSAREALRVRRMAKEAEDRRSERETREERARAELERLKAELKAKREE